MDRTELIDNLNSYGRRLATESIAADEMAKGLGLGLLALSELIREMSSDDPSVASAASPFKAKSNRW